MTKEHNRNVSFRRCFDNGELRLRPRAAGACSLFFIWNVFPRGKVKSRFNKPLTEASIPVVTESWKVSLVRSLPHSWPEIAISQVKDETAQNTWIEEGCVELVDD